MIQVSRFSFFFSLYRRLMLSKCTLSSTLLSPGWNRASFIFFCHPFLLREHLDRGLPISSFTLASKIICDVTYFDESCGEPPFSALLRVAFLMFSFSLPLVCRMFLTLRFTADQQGHMRDSIYLNKCVVSFSSPCCHSDVLFQFNSF